MNWLKRPASDTQITHRDRLWLYIVAANRITSVATSSTTPSALAAPQLNWFSRIAVICVDTITTRPPPSTAGVT